MYFAQTVSFLYIENTISRRTKAFTKYREKLLKTKKYEKMNPKKKKG